MKVQVEKLEKNTAKLTVTVEAAQFEKALNDAYLKNKNRFSVPGFRKGKVPKVMIEKMYGPSVFYEDAIDDILDKTYPLAVKEAVDQGVEVASRPEIGIEEIVKGEDLVYTATVAVKPPVELGEYIGVSVEKADTTVSAKDVNAELKRVQEKNARVTTMDESYRIKKNDTAVIDFEGFTDGKAFEGGKGEDFPLVIGSGQFIPGFEDQLIGHTAGESIDVNVTFPEVYQAAELAGKPAVFKCSIKEVKVKELPALDDEFASEVSEFDTLKEYKASLKAELKLRKESQAAQINENNVLKAVVENAKVEVPEAMVETELDGVCNDYNLRLKQQGLSLEVYLQYMGQTLEEFRESQKPQTETMIKTRLVIEAVSRAEKITASDEAVDAELKAMAEAYKADFAELKGMYSEQQMEAFRNDLTMKETVKFLVDKAVFTSAEKKSRSEKAEDEEKEAE